MKIKALKNFQSIFFHMVEGEIKEVELNASIIENWVKNGLIEVVKAPVKKSVKTDENK